MFWCLLFSLGCFSLSFAFSIHLPSRHFTGIRMQTSQMNSHSQEQAFELYQRFRNTSATDANLGAKLHSALDVLDNALRLYGPDNVYSSYNGGKDAVVIMHLLRACVAKYNHDNNATHQPLLIYFAVTDEFPEVLAYIEESECQLGLPLIRSNSSIIKGLQEIITSKQSIGGTTQHLAFVLGTRQGDPNCGQQSFFSPSSSWMPPFMRVNPIIDWNYGQVWHFLRYFQLSYCILYDQGYTSLGKKSDTRPNPVLRKNKHIGEHVNNNAEFYPAYMLADWSLERAGRGLPEPPISTTEAGTEEQQRMHASSAGMIIIGDEILNGFTSESNLQITSTALGGVGVPLKRVVVVSDNEEEIAREVRRMSQEYDVVITSGGIGPTHDDVTIKAVASAFGETIQANPEMLAHLTRAHAASGSKEPIRASFLRLAELPTQSKLRFPPSPPVNPLGSNKLLWPILQCNNVFVLPGVPEFFSDKINTIAAHFLHAKKTLFFRAIKLTVEEKDIVTVLNDAVEVYPTVKFGSYPFVSRRDYQTIITLQGTEEEVLMQAIGHLKQRLPTGAVLEDVLKEVSSVTPPPQV